MRCLGLTSDKHRCAADAISAAGYCEQHDREMTEIAEPADAWPDKQSRMTGFIDKLRPSPSRRLVPDSAKFDLPSWLAKSNTETVIDHLLYNPSSLTRWHAALVLRKRRDPRSIDALWRTLKQDAVVLVRQQAAVALGKIGTAATLAPLTEALWHDPDANVRQASAIALGNLGYRVAADDLANALDREQAAFVRWDCIVALGQVGDPTAEPLLARIESGDRIEWLRRAGAEAIAQIRRRA
jgi:HEAT repeats/PBS lyase HEAT-like repeat